MRATRGQFYSRVKTKDKPIKTLKIDEQSFFNLKFAQARAKKHFSSWLLFGKILKFQNLPELSEIATRTGNTMRELQLALKKHNSVRVRLSRLPAPSKQTNGTDES